MGIVVVLVLVFVLASLWLTRKRLLGWLISRASKSDKFKLSIGSVSFSGLSGISLELHKGPLKALSIEWLGLGADAAQPEVGFLQSLMAGTLRLPLKLRGIHIQLAYIQPSAITVESEWNVSRSMEDATAGASQVPVHSPSLSEAQQAGLSKPSSGSDILNHRQQQQHATVGMSAEQPRPKSKLILSLLQLVSVALEELTLSVEDLGLQLSLQCAHMCLNTSQQLCLSRLAVSWLGGQQGGGGSGPDEQAQQLLSVSSFRVQHTPSSAGLCWLQEPGWTLGRVACTLGEVVVDPPHEAITHLLRVLRRQGAVRGLEAGSQVAQRGGGGQSAGAPDSGSPGAEWQKEKGLAPKALLRRLPREVTLELGSLRGGAAAHELVGTLELGSLAVQCVQPAAVAAALGVARPIQHAPQDAAGTGGDAALRTRQLPPLACLTASWHKLECGLTSQGTAPAVPAVLGASSAHAPPPAFSLGCKSTELSAQLDCAARCPEGAAQTLGAHASSTGAATPRTSSDTNENGPARNDAGESGQARPQLQLCLDASINAMHTRVGYEAVPALLVALKQLRKGQTGQAARKQADVVSRAGISPPAQHDSHSSAAPASPPAASLATPAEPVAQAGSAAASKPGEGQFGKGASGHAARGGGEGFLPQLAPAGWQLRVKLGEGSSLRFVDGGGEDRWVSSIGSARLNVAQQAQQQRSQQAAAGNRRAALVALEFEVDMIEMHAPQSAAAGAHPLAQMLAAKRLSLELQPLQEGHPSLAGALSAVGVHALLQREVLSTMAAILSGMLHLPAAPPAELIPLKPPPESAGAGTGSAHPPIPPSQLVASSAAKKRGPPPLDLSHFTVSFTDTAVVLPHASSVPEGQSLDGKGVCIQGGVAVVASSVWGVARRRQRHPELKLEQVDVVYLEGAHSMQLPGGAQSIRDHAKDTLLALNSASLLHQNIPYTSQEPHPQLDSDPQPSTATPPEAALPPGVPLGPRFASCKLRLEGLQAVLAADAVLCAAAVAAGVADLVHLMPAVRSDRQAGQSGGAGLGMKEMVPKGGSVQCHSAGDENGLLGVREGEVVEGGGLAGARKEAEDPTDAEDIATLNQQRSRTSTAASEAASGGQHMGVKGCTMAGTESHGAVASGAATAGAGVEVEVEGCSLGLPLSEELRVDLEVTSAAGSWGEPRGQLLLRSTAVSINGKAVMSWQELQAGIQVAGRGRGGAGAAGARLAVGPLDHMPEPRQAGMPSAGSAAEVGTAQLAGRASAARPSLAGMGFTQEQEVEEGRLETEDDDEGGGGDTIPAVLSSSSSPTKAQSLAREGGVGGASGAGLSHVPEHPGFTPYHKARLHSWMDSMPSMDDVHSTLGGRGAEYETVEGTGEGEGEGHSDSLGTGPCSVVDVQLAGFELRVPHDREPGPCQRYAEMYFKALMTAMEGELARLKGAMAAARTWGGRLATDTSRKAQKAQASLFPMQLNLAADDVVVRFEHHPMEGWLGVHGPLLQKMAIQQQLWADIATTVQPANTAAPLHAAMVEGAFASAAEAGHRAWEGVMRDLFQTYRTLVHKTEQEAQGHERDLMHIKATAVRGLGVVCGGDAAGTVAALQTVRQVDAASRGVQLIQLRKFHVDVAVEGFSMHIASCQQPFVSASRGRVSGVLAVARQATAPPLLRQRSIPVGSHRVVPVGVTIKGCRAPFKVYTDAEADLGVVGVRYSQGMEPTMMLLGMAGKRLAPTDPDKSVPRPPPIPWWDDIRYMWRGVLGVRARDFCFSMGMGVQPGVDHTSQRMVVEASEVRGELLSGDYSLAAKGLTATLFEAGGLEQPAGTLLLLPFARFPDAQFRLKLDWKLPKGRQAEQHHLFPAVPPAGAAQEPIVLAEEYKSQSLDLLIEAQLGQQGEVLEAQPSSTPTGFLGDHQVQWMRSFVHSLQRPPGYLRALVRRGTFFVRKPRPAVPKRGIPKLINQLDLVVLASPIDVVHFTVRDDDPSSAVCISAAKCGFAGCWLLNQPIPTFLRPPPHARGKGPLLPPTRSISKDFRVSADDVRVFHPSGEEGVPKGGVGGGLAGAKLRRGDTDVDQGHLSVAFKKEDIIRRPSLLNRLFSSASTAPQGQRPIGMAATVGVSSMGQGAGEEGEGLASGSGGAGGGPAENPGGDPDGSPDCLTALDPPPRRPLKITIRDCKFLVDLEARNAIWGVIDHLVNAFILPTASQATNAAAASMVNPSPTLQSPSLSSLSARLSPAAQMHRRLSQGNSMTLMSPGRSEDQSQNELLDLLLKQREAQEGEEGGAEHASTADLGASGSDPDLGEEPLTSPLEEALSDLKYEIEVINLQINLEAETTQGRFLLAARRGKVAGSSLLDPALNITTMQLEEVQAYVARVDVDPQGSVAWLETGEGEFKAPEEDEASAMRRVFNPIRIHMRHSKVPSAAARRMREGGSHIRRTPTPLGPGQVACVYGGRGEELVLKVPEIIAIMDSREFEIMVDVISNVGLAQPPTMENVNAETELLLEVEGEEVEDARQMFAMVRQQLASARQEALEVRRFVGLRKLRSRSSSMGSSRQSLGAEAGTVPLPAAGTGVTAGVECHHFVASESDAQAAMHFKNAAELAVALREHLGATSAAAAAAAAASAALQSQLARPSSRQDLLQGLASTSSGRRDSSSLPECRLSGAGEEAALGSQGDGEGEGASPHHSRSSDMAYTEPVAAADAAGVAAQAETGPEGTLGSAGSLQNQRSSGNSRRLLLRQEEGLRVRQLRRALQQQQALLLRWVEEQEEGALQTFEKAKAALIALKAVARKRQSTRHASRVLLQVDRVVWQLCSVARAEMFVQASITDLSLDIFRNKDRSGSNKFVIHRIEVKDSQGNLEAAPGTEAGVILSVWNPDKSWERDPMVRVNATLGVPTKTHIVYDLLDLTVHPLGVHLTEAIAVKFWEYFFPQEPDTSKRQVKFAQSVAVTGSSRHRRAATAIPTEWDYGASGSRRGLGLAKDASLDSGGGSGSALGSGGNSPRPSWKGGSSRLHRRSSSVDVLSATSSGVGTHGRELATLAVDVQQAAEEALAQEGTAMEEVTSSALSGLAGTGSSRGGLGEAVSEEGSAIVPVPPQASPAPIGLVRSGRLSCVEETPAAVQVPGRKTRFVYVRVNRAHCRVTYEGQRLSVSDLKFVSDNMTYENLEGRWRDLFNRMKWDAIKSALKSIAGLQGRKFKELLPEGFGEEAGDGKGERGRKGHSLMASLGLGKGRRAQEGEGMSGEEVKAMQKMRLLVGDQHLGRFSASSLTRTSGTTTAVGPSRLPHPQHAEQAPGSPHVTPGGSPGFPHSPSPLSRGGGASPPFSDPGPHPGSPGAHAARERQRGGSGARSVSSEEAALESASTSAGGAGESSRETRPPLATPLPQPEGAAPFQPTLLDYPSAPGPLQERLEAGAGGGGGGGSSAAGLLPPSPFKSRSGSSGEEAELAQQAQHGSRHGRHGSLGGWVQRVAERAEKGIKKLAK